MANSNISHMIIGAIQRVGKPWGWPHLMLPMPASCISVIFIISGEQLNYLQHSLSLDFIPSVRAFVCPSAVMGCRQCCLYNWDTLFCFQFASNSVALIRVSKLWHQICFLCFPQLGIKNRSDVFQWDIRVSTILNGHAKISTPCKHTTLKPLLQRDQFFEFNLQTNVPTKQVPSLVSTSIGTSVATSPSSAGLSIFGAHLLPSIVTVYLDIDMMPP